MKRSEKMRLFIFTAHSGGHFFPALSFAESFKVRHPDCEIHFVSDRKKDDLPFCLSGFPYEYHAIGGVSGRSRGLGILLFPFSLLKAFFETSRLISKYSPSVVVGFGTIVSLLGILAARFRSIPTLVHEQNRKLGKANRVLALLSQSVAVSFDETLNQVPKKKGILTGNPLRPSIVGSKFSLENNTHFRILVFGGSQGARRINNAFISALRAMGDEERRKYAVIHITGRNNLAEVESLYRNLEVDHKLIDFTDRIADCYAKSDFVIARAGAGTIFETAYFGVPALFVPYPGAHSHQEANASYVSSHHAGLTMRDNELSSDTLLSCLRSMKDDSVRRKEMGENARRLFQHDGGERLVQAVENIMITQI